MLLLWPCWWGAALATPLGSFPDLTLLGLFSVGNNVVRIVCPCHPILILPAVSEYHRSLSIRRRIFDANSRLHH